MSSGAGAKVLSQSHASSRGSLLADALLLLEQMNIKWARSAPHPAGPRGWGGLDSCKSLKISFFSEMFGQQDLANLPHNISRWPKAEGISKTVSQINGSSAFFSSVSAVTIKKGLFQPSASR